MGSAFLIGFLVSLWVQVMAYQIGYLWQKGKNNANRHS